MKKGLAFFCSLILCGQLMASNKQFDTMVIFGDSLSDNGNLYSYLWGIMPVSPPYYQGHFSNGPVWIEQLYQSYYPAGYSEGFQDYAVGGAGAVLSYKENLPYTLSVELKNYFYWHTHGKKDSTLFVIWIGANNYLNGPSNVESITDSVVESIGSGVEQLIKAGGNKFLLANLPDMSYLPQSADFGNQALLTRLSDLHNQKLAARLELLKQKYPEVSFVYFDAYTFFNRAVSNPADMGLVNIKDPCYSGSYSGWLLAPTEQQLHQFMQEKNPKMTERQWQMIKTNPVLKEAATTGFMAALLPQNVLSEPQSCEGYLFWDHVHPTTYAHAAIAEEVRSLLDEAGFTAVNPDTGSQ